MLFGYFPCQELSELTRKDAIADFSQSQSPRIKLTAETSKLPPEACRGHPYRTWQELQRRASARYSSWQEAKKSKAVKAEAALAMPKKTRQLRLWGAKRRTATLCAKRLKSAFRPTASTSSFRPCVRSWSRRSLSLKPGHRTLGALCMPQGQSMQLANEADGGTHAPLVGHHGGGGVREAVRAMQHLHLSLSARRAKLDRRKKGMPSRSAPSFSSRF